jgi:hypothetical protein
MLNLFTKNKEQTNTSTSLKDDIIKKVEDHIEKIVSIYHDETLDLITKIESMKSYDLSSKYTKSLLEFDLPIAYLYEELLNKAQLVIDSKKVGDLTMREYTFASKYLYYNAVDKFKWPDDPRRIFCSNLLG